MVWDQLLLLQYDRDMEQWLVQAWVVNWMQMPVLKDWNLTQCLKVV